MSGVVVDRAQPDSAQSEKQRRALFFRAVAVTATPLMPAGRVTSHFENLCSRSCGSGYTRDMRAIFLSLVVLGGAGLMAQAQSPQQLFEAGQNDQAMSAIAQQRKQRRVRPGPGLPCGPDSAEGQSDRQRETRVPDAGPIRGSLEVDWRVGAGIDRRRHCAGSRGSNSGGEDVARSVRGSVSARNRESTARRLGRIGRGPRSRDADQPGVCLRALPRRSGLLQDQQDGSCGRALRTVSQAGARSARACRRGVGDADAAGTIRRERAGSERMAEREIPTEGPSSSRNWRREIEPEQPDRSCQP